MVIQINDIQVDLPTNLREITLGQRIDYATQYGDASDKRFAKLRKMPAGDEKDVALTAWQQDKMFYEMAFFTGVPLQVLKNSGLDDDIKAIHEASLADLIEVEITDRDAGDDDESIPADLPHLHAEPKSYEWNGEAWLLPSAVLQPDSTMQLGEFVDSKQMVKQMTDKRVGRYEYLLPLCAIFLRRQDEPYEEKFLYPNGERLKLMKSVPLDTALEVGSFYDELSSFINENFPVFHKSKGKSGQNIKNHFAFWGWLEFVIEVAGAPQFLRPGTGMNGIECARASKLYDVLVWASANKERNEAEYLDHLAEVERNKI